MLSSTLGSAHKNKKSPSQNLGSEKGKIPQNEYRQFKIASLNQRCSIPVLLTLAFLILSGSHAGPFAGFGTVSIRPVKTWTLLVPRSRSRISVCPRVAAFSAAPRGCLLAKTWLVSSPFFIRTKYFFSPIGYTSPGLRTPKGYNISPVKPLYCATYWAQ